MELSIGYCIIENDFSKGEQRIKNTSSIINTDDIKELTLIYDHSDDAMEVIVVMKDGKEFFGKESYHYKENDIEKWESLPHRSFHTDGNEVWE